MESWKRAFRDGFAPAMTGPQLESLATGLRSDDARLLQGATTNPPPLMAVQDWTCEGACALGYPTMAAGAIFRALGRVW